MNRKLPFLLLTPVFVLAMLIVTLASPLDASAASGQKHFMPVKTKQSQTANIRRASNNLLYHGGPIMPGTSQVYAIFWEPAGSFVSANYNSLIQRYFNDVGSSGLYRINTQYNDSGGNVPSNSTLVTSWVDTANYPSTQLSDGDIQQEVTHAMQVNGWQPAINKVFFVFTAKNENICFGTDCSFTSFCAYHSSFGSNTIYAAMPYTGTNLSACGVPSSPNGDRDADSTINVTSHEQMEAATDPLLNAWYDSSGQENGDKCAWQFQGNVNWNGNTYLVQPEWNNATSSCALTGP